MAVIDWNRYRKCPVCFAALAAPCMTLTGTCAADAAAVPRDRPHSRRQLRAGYARAGGAR